jgi:hypothetical protein
VATVVITQAMIDSFRAEFFAFSDVTKWPDALISCALCEADAETGSSRWGAYEDECHNFKRRGMFYFAAHWLSTNYGTAGVTADPASEARLNVQSKSVGDESIEFRVPKMMDVGSDWLTFTVYGQQFYRLRRRAGMGAIAL